MWTDRLTALKRAYLNWMSTVGRVFGRRVVADDVEVDLRLVAALLPI